MGSRSTIDDTQVPKYVLLIIVNLISGPLMVKNHDKKSYKKRWKKIKYVFLDKRTKTTFDLNKSEINLIDTKKSVRESSKSLGIEELRI